MFFLRLCALLLVGMAFHGLQAQKCDLPGLLAGRSAVCDSVMARPGDFRLQILYTQINRNSQGKARFKSYSFRVDEGEYFYPASTVKLPVAVLALEKIRQLNIAALDAHTPMFHDSAAQGQTAALRDTSAANGLPSVAHYLRKIFLTSDNDAYNRLYEFAGPCAINQRLKALGYRRVRITHRLALSLSREQHARSNPVRFVQAGRELYRQEAAFCADMPQAQAPVRLGSGYISQGKRVNEPMDFGWRNAFPLEAQQRLLRTLFFPSSAPKARRVELRDADYELIYRAMGEFPRESASPRYALPDGYVKFLMYGDRPDSIPPNIRIFNKVGVAYGFLSDNAYVADFDRNIEFLLSATIYVNADGIFNDDVYEYETLGYPFLGELGRAIYEHECKRSRRHAPDLTPLRRLFD